MDENAGGISLSVKELVAANKVLLRENRELRAENQRLIRELERKRKQAKGPGQK